MTNAQLSEYKMVSIDEIKEHPKNPRIHPESAVNRLVKSIEEFGFTNPVLLSKDGFILAGHARLKASKRAGLSEVPAISLDLEGEMADAYLIADNKLQEETEWDIPILKDLLEELDIGNIDIELTGFDEEEIENLMTQFHLDEEEDPEVLTGEEGTATEEEAKLTLFDRFGIPPFTILDSRQGYWMQRKRAWLSIGIKSELGRGMDTSEEEGSKGGVLFDSDSGRDPIFYKKKRKLEKELGHEITTKEYLEKYYQAETGGSTLSDSGSSVFDPVLCELAYSWFSPQDGIVIDPFAGGSVRGVIAGRLGREYHGIDLRDEQIKANEAQAEEISYITKKPTWYSGDSTNLDEILPNNLQADFIFSCPPYADLEVYSDKAEDLSNMDYEDFLFAYRTIIKKAVNKLKDNSFAAFVVGDIRDKKGFYRNFVSDTIQAFIDAGMKYYNEGIYLNTLGSLPIRVGRQFGSYRKLGKAHQNFLVFYKGNPKAIPERLGEINVSDILETMGIEDEGIEDLPDGDIEKKD